MISPVILKLDMAVTPLSLSRSIYLVSRLDADRKPSQRPMVSDAGNSLRKKIDASTVV